MAGKKQEKQEENRRVFGGNVSTFAELMEQVAALPTEQQEKLSFYIQGYVACWQEAGRDMTADERRSKVIRDFYRVYKEYGQLDNVRYHMRVEMSGDALIEIHRYYGDRKGERILRVTHEEVEGAEVSAEVAAYEQAADQLINMIKARRESLEENERRRQEARRWA